jgi:hypothetical protein
MNTTHASAIHTPSTLFRVAAILVCTSLGLAQTTWVVDKANGPGTTHTTLGTAINAAGGNEFFRNSGRGGSAIVAKNSRVMVRGTSTLATGKGGFTAHAIEGDYLSNLFIDPLVTIRASGQKITGFRARLTKTLPVLRSLNQPITGQLFRYQVTGTAGAAYSVFFSLPWTGFSLPDQEAFLFHPSICILLHRGSLDSAGKAMFGLPISTDPKWGLLTFMMQGTTATSAGWDMTNEMIVGQR